MGNEGNVSLPVPRNGTLNRVLGRDVGESLMVASNLEMESVFQQVKSWPAESRIALARRVLETLDADSSPTAVGLKGPSSEQVLGLWNPGMPAPTDTETDRILAEELQRKHAS